MTPPDDEAVERWSATERRELYRVLDINNKLASHQVRLVERKTNYGTPKGFPLGTVGQSYEVRLVINDFEICRVHTYELNGRRLTDLDPKWFKIDDLIIKQ